MAPKRYSLDIPRIETAIDNFANLHPVIILEQHRLSNPYGIQVIFEEIKGKKKGYLNCYFSHGKVSFQAQGSLKQIADDCQNYIINHTKLPAEDARCVSVYDIDEEVLDVWLEHLENEGIVSKPIEIKPSTDHILRLVRLKGEYGAVVTVTLFRNGRLMIQGLLTSLLIKTTSSLLEISQEDSKHLINQVFTLEPDRKIFIEPDISKEYPHIEQLKSSVIYQWIQSSIYLINSNMELPEYSSHSFDILKALEGVLRSSIIEECGDDIKDFCQYFKRDNSQSPYHFNSDCTLFDYNPPYKHSLEKAYDFYHKHRHSTFHTDPTDIESSRMLDFDDALNIVNESLVIIDEICKHRK